RGGDPLAPPAPASPPAVAEPAPPAQAGAKRSGSSSPALDRAADGHLARQQALREAQEFGMIGALNSTAERADRPGEEKAKTGSGDVNERVIAGTDDSTSVPGSMWGSEIGDAFGAGGLGLTGVGPGGGGGGDLELGAGGGQIRPGAAGGGLSG